MHSQNSKLQSAGFTLVELMVTVAIMAIIAGLTFGNMNTASYRLKSTAHTLKSHMTQAKLEAVKRDLNVKVKINGTGDGYNITSIDSAGNVITIINTTKYTNKFSFSGSNITFTPRGTANSGSITIVSKGTTNPEYTISVNNIGRIRLEKTKN